MHLFARRAATLALFAALLVLLGARGLLPALTRVTADFPSYLTASRIVADGGRTDRLYDIPWFQEQMRRYGIGKPSAGKFAPCPPPTALLLVPLARLRPLTALRVVSAVSLLCLAGSIVLLARILASSLLDTAVFVLLSGHAIVGALRFGQPYIVVSACCILGYYAYLKGRPWLAGVSLGVFTPIKYFPVVLLAYFAVRRQWRLVAAGALTIALVTLVSIAVLGWSVHAQFLESVLGNHLLGRLEMQDPFSASFQSFDSLFRDLFVFDPATNPRPWVRAPVLELVGVPLIKAALLAVAILTLMRRARGPLASAAAPSVGLLGVLTLLLAPATASYHFALLWLPVGLLVRQLLATGARACAWLVLGAYTLIGFFPYGRTSGFAGRGALTLLAYPRLLLLLVVFAACVAGLWRRQPQRVAGGVPAPRAERVGP